MLTLPYLSSLKFVGRLSTGILSQIELPAFLLLSAGSLCEEKDLSGGLSNFLYEDFHIKDKQKMYVLELGGMYAPVCLEKKSLHKTSSLRPVFFSTPPSVWGSVGVVPFLAEAFKVTGNSMTRHESSHRGHHAAPT